MDLEDRHRAARLARAEVDPEHARDRRDRREGVGHLAAEAVGEEAAVGHPRCVDAVRIYAVVRRDFRDERLDERDVVDRVRPRGAAAFPRVPARRDALGVRDEKPVRVGGVVHPREEDLLGAVRAEAVEVQDERETVEAVVARRRVDARGARHPSGGERERGVAGSAGAAAGRGDRSAVRVARVEPRSCVGRRGVVARVGPRGAEVDARVRVGARVELRVAGRRLEARRARSRAARGDQESERARGERREGNDEGTKLQRHGRRVV